jgi:hypothetical protein
MNPVENLLTTGRFVVGPVDRLGFRASRNAIQNVTVRHQHATDLEPTGFPQVLHRHNVLLPWILQMQLAPS